MQFFTKMINVIILAICVHSNAMSQDLNFEMSLSYVSEYADRGATVAGEHILYAFSVSSGNFSTNATYARGIGEDKFMFADELDFNIDYGFTITSLVSANAGADIIYDPDAGGLFDLDKDGASTLEVYSGVSFDIPLTPTLNAIYDIYLNDFTLEGTVDHTMHLSRKTQFSIQLIGGYAAINQDEDNLYITSSLVAQSQLTDAFKVFSGISAGLSSRATFTNAQYHGRNITPTFDLKSSSVWMHIGISSQF